MRPNPRARSKFRLQGVAAAALACCVPVSGWSADTDIYGPPGAAGGGPNVVFLLDNTSNWSANNQAWKKSDVLAKCDSKPADQKALCQNYVGQVFGAAADLTQGQVQLRALKLVLNELVCNAGTAALDINMGLSLLSKQSTLSNGHPVGVINFAVQPLLTTVAAGYTKSSCARIVEQLDLIDAKIQDPDWKAPSDANYGAAYYEIFKYFGGHSNPNLAGNPNPNGGSPLGETGYGPVRFSKKNVLDDPAAFTNGTTRTTYTSPLSGAAACGNNYVVLVGNTYPNAEPSNGGPVRFQGINYTPPALSAVTSDTSRFADEWSYFMANTDVIDAPGQQRVFSYAINTYNNQPDANQGKLLKSMAAVGGIGAGGYLEVGGDLYALILAFKKIFFDIASVNSVFTATTLPVSTTTQGTFLNQVFVGMFRPDAKGSPRWVGNLKQYQLGVVNKLLTMVDKNGASATLGGAGFFSPSAESFWSESSVFFDQKPSGTPASASDLPDGAIVEKGGAAFQLRKKYIGSTAANSAAGRNVKTLNSTLDALADFSVLPATPSDVVMPAWIRGMNNVLATDPGAEAFIGSYDNAGTPALLGATGARHSMHGDVLHSRPVALNYGSSGVVVYYGANDGFLRAVDGNKTGTTAGQELWSFVAPEHYDQFARLRSGTPLLHLPETNSAGATVPAPTGTATKSYGMDGAIGVYAKYGAGANPSVSEAFIYPTMRRGGRSVYAFNVSNPTSPTFKWRIQGGVTSGFTNLAQTWSMPKAVVFKSASAQAPMLIMGGGYDEAEDANGSSSVGNAIYIINGDTGDHIKTLTTDYSVPSDVTVIDVDFDGQPDRAYVADVRGNLYRIDFPASAPLSSASWTSVQAVKIANVGGKVFFPPDVVVTKSFVAVMVGTGDREKPLVNSSADHFVMVKDTLPTQTPSGTVATLSDLAHIASVDNATMNMVPTASPGSKDKGCYISLATNGEKVVNAPFTIAGATYFGTNRPPPANANACSANLGEAYAYKFPLFCEVPAKPSQILGGGLPPSPVGGIVTIDIGGVPTQVPFLIGGSGPSAFDVAEPKPPIPPIRTRQHWRIDNSNR
jgi:type IV pilus assembly protein PilY1